MYGNSRLRNLDFLLQTMGWNVSEGGGLISEAAEDDGNGGRQWEMQECDGWQRKTAGVADAFGRRQKMAVRHTTIAFSEGGWRSCVSLLQSSSDVFRSASALFPVLLLEPTPIPNPIHNKFLEIRLFSTCDYMAFPQPNRVIWSNWGTQLYGYEGHSILISIILCNPLI